MNLCAVLLLAMWLSVGNIAVCAESGTNLSEVSGVVKACQEWDEGQYVLVFDDRIQGDVKEPPINRDKIGLYDETTETIEIIYQGENIWNSYDDQLLINGQKMIYNNGADKFMMDKVGAGEKREVHMQACHQLQAVSSKMNYYVERDDEALTVVHDLTGETRAVLAQADMSTYMAWGADERLIAIVGDNNSSVSLWDLENNSSQKFRTGAELAAPEKWVEISGIQFVKGTDVVLINYLCERGNSITIWDTQNDRFYEGLAAEGEIMVLDASGEQILYTRDDADGDKKRSLHVYYFATGEDRLLERSDVFYTAGCILNSGQELMVNKWDRTKRLNTLTKIGV